MRSYKNLFLWGVGVVAVVALLTCLSLLLDDKVFEHVSKVVLGVGGAIGIGLATWRNIVSQSQVDIAQKQATIAHRSQVSDQWTRAMDLLTRADKNDFPLIEARIGGLHSLSALAYADPEGYGVQVMKNMVAYIKANAQKTAEHYPNEPEKRAFPSPLGEDVQTAFRLLRRVYDSDEIQALRQQGKLKRFFDKMWEQEEDLNFSKADFRKLNFRGVEWTKRPYLRGAQLQGADLHWAHLQGADLSVANLQGADLSNTNLQGADLQCTRLQGADLHWTHLQGADLSLVHLQGANLQWAHLQGADLSEAHLQGADLNDTALDFSTWHDAQFHTSRENLKNLLNKDETPLPQGRITAILERFDEKGNKGLWQPNSARIICDEKNFSPLRKYNHPATKFLDPDDENIDWQEEWRKTILDKISPSDLPYVIRGLIHNYGNPLNIDENTPCTQGLRVAVNKITKKHPVIKKELSDYNKKWLEKPSSA